MRFFVTGSTGFIGSHVVDNLLAHGHTVVGLTRHEKTAAELKAKGAEPVIGSIEDLDLLKKAVADADAVVHLAFGHDFSKFAESCANDRAAITAMGDALVATGDKNRALVVTSGTLMLKQGELCDEDSAAITDNPMAQLRSPSETLTLSYGQKGIRAAVVRLAPSVHGDGSAGFAGMLSRLSMELGYVPQIDVGNNHWSACNVIDAADLYRLAGEKGGLGGVVYHGVGEQSVLFRDIASAIGKELGMPVKSLDAAAAAQAVGWFMVGLIADSMVSSEKTQKALDWKPVHAGVVENMPVIAKCAKEFVESGAKH